MTFVAIGANLPGVDGSLALQTCLRAAAMLDATPGIRNIALSRWYETIAQPPSGQPNYLNAVIQLDCTLTPEQLLAELHAIERAAGRMRTVPNAARVLDLDILGMGSLVRAPPTADPVLPHPRMHLRAFVLAPLCDLAPDWRHPVLLKTAAELLATLPDQGVTPLS